MDIEKALQRLFNLGQTYWAQADSESAAEHRKSSITHDSAKDLMNDVHKFVESISAENARLQAIIDEAKAQEPVGVFNGKFNVSINDKITFEVNCYDALPEAGARLYAASIPVQQSPAVAAPYPTAESYEQDLVDKFFHELTPSPRITEQDSDGYMCGEHYELGLWSRRNIEAFIADGNRIGGVTEQYAREIIDHYRKSDFSKFALKTDEILRYWLDAGGRALLEKLNK